MRGPRELFIMTRKAVEFSTPPALFTILELVLKHTNLLMNLTPFGGCKVNAMMEMTIDYSLVMRLYS